MSERVLFNCIPWYGQTLIQGNKSFFLLLAELLDAVSEKTLERNFEKGQLTTGDKVDLVALDIKESNVCTDPSWCSEYTEDSFFFRFNNLQQLTLSRQVAFEIGERVRAALGIRGDDIEQNDLKAIYAFSRVIQNSCVAYKPR